MQKVFRNLAMTAVAAVFGFTLATAPGCSDSGSKVTDAGPTGKKCADADADTQEANCVCNAKTDCAAGNTAKWACTPAHACVRICTTATDCNTGSVCEDLICRPPACGDDSECTGGQLCIGGSCKAAVTTVASCAVAPDNGVIAAGGSKRFWVIAYDSAGVAVPYKGAVTWGATGIAATAAGSSVTATYSSAATAAVTTGTVTATIGGTSCTAANVTEYGPVASGVRVVVVSEGATASKASETAISGATVVLDGETKTSDTNGVASFDVTAGAHTVSVFATGYSYVTVVGTTATDILVPVKAAPAPGNFDGQLKDTDFANVDNKNGTLHLDITGSSIAGNLIDLSLSTLLGPSQPITISLGTGTPYGPFDLPKGIAIGLGAQMFGENGGGHYGAVATPGYRALWSLGGNAVIGDVLKAIGPVLNGGGGDIADQIPTILTALLPIIGSLDSAVTSGLKVAPGDQKTLSFGGAAPSLKLDTAQRLHLLATTPHLPSYVNDAGNTANYDGAIIIGGSLVSPQGLVPLGLTAAIDQGGPGGAMVPDQITDAVGTGGQPGKVPLRVAPRHGGIESSPWAFVTLGASIKDLVGGFGGADAPSQGIVLSGNVSLYEKGTTTPFALKYNGGANTNIDLSTEFLVPPNLPTISGRTVTLAADSAGTSFSRLDVGSEDKQWAIYYPAGTTSIEVPAVPSGFDDRWVGTGTELPGINLQTVSLGYDIPGAAAGTKATYNSVWQFDGVDAADLTSEIDRFSLRALPARTP